MAYQITKFDAVNLPVYNPAQDLSTGRTDSTQRIYIGGGAIDYAGARRMLPRTQTLEVNGAYYGEKSYWVTHAGANMVDHNGNRLLVGTGAAMLRQQVEELTAKTGVRGTLYRQRLDTGELQIRLARLLQVKHNSKVDERAERADLTCTFELLRPAWRSPTAIVTSGVTSVPIPVSIGGNVPVRDAVLALTATATITSVAITGPGISLAWTGTLSAGSALRIDAGLRTVRIGTTDAYSGFNYGSGHTDDGWLGMDPGINVLTVTANAAGTVAVTTYDQWL